MKKLLFTTLMIVFVSGVISYGQSFDWNIRGGLNLMNSRTSGKDLSLLYHAGIQAGVRITNFGFYGEAVYSMHENKYRGDPIAYFLPAIIVKGFWRKSIFVQVGGTLLNKIGDSGVANDDLNPDGKLFMIAGFGAHISKIELSLRSIVNPNQSSYGVIQITAAFKF
jgi:hypothetical protein